MEDFSAVILFLPCMKNKNIIAVLRNKHRSKSLRVWSHPCTLHHPPTSCLTVPRGLAGTSLLAPPKCLLSSHS
jgi:hypothetical protein